MAADVNDHQSPIDERRHRRVIERLDRRRRLLPDLAARLGVEGRDDAAHAQGVDAPIGEGGRGLGAGAVRACRRRVRLERRRVARLPHGLPGRGVERDDGLLRVPGTAPVPAVSAAVQRVEPAGVREDRRVTHAERTAPQNARTVRGPGLRQASGRHDEVAGGTAPLSPG